MAVITQDTFDPLKTRVSVRLQQGVPIVDADWNEADDIRRFELRAYLKWFVGDGVPEGNDGFRITPAAAPASSDFLIRTSSPPPGGTGGVEIALRYAGRCIVDGLDVMIMADIVFSAQPLHPSQAGAAALAARLGVPVIDTAPLTTAGVATVAVYLDVWERLVTPTEDPSMILPALNIESCARRKREWVVRVAAGESAPAPAAGHGHYVLAWIHRPLNAPETIQDAHVVDRRERRLLTLPATIVSDAFGGNVADYRRGVGRPATSLRDAINAVARGELPGTPTAVIPTAAGGSEAYDAWYPSLVLDRSNGLIASWLVYDYAIEEYIVRCARLDLSNAAVGFSSIIELRNVADVYVWSLLSLPGGDLVVAFTKRGASPTFAKPTGVGGLDARRALKIVHALWMWRPVIAT
ncbi:DUF6519 domain-containing protein [Sorangium sp. So ce216]